MSVVHRYKWDPAELASADIPEAAKSFLVSKGLPVTMGATTFEFGPYDCEGAFVIGQDYDYAIHIAPDGSVWHEGEDDESDDRFMNSSVQLLGRFIEVFNSLPTESDFVSDEDFRKAVQSAVNSLKAEDPAAFADKEKGVWPLFWEDILNLI